MPGLGFGFGLNKPFKILKKEFKGPVNFEPSFSVTATLEYIERQIVTTQNDCEESLTATATLEYIERQIVTTQNDCEESLTATANLTYTVSVA